MLQRICGHIPHFVPVSKHLTVFLRDGAVQLKYICKVLRGADIFPVLSVVCSNPWVICFMTKQYCIWLDTKSSANFHTFCGYIRVLPI